MLSEARIFGLVFVLGLMLGSLGLIVARQGLSGGMPSTDDTGLGLPTQLLLLTLGSGLLSGSAVLARRQHHQRETERLLLLPGFSPFMQAEGTQPPRRIFRRLLPGAVVSLEPLGPSEEKPGLLLRLVSETPLTLTLRASRSPTDPPVPLGDERLDGWLRAPHAITLEGRAHLTADVRSQLIQLREAGIVELHIEGRQMLGRLEGAPPSPTVLARLLGILRTLQGALSLSLVLSPSLLARGLADPHPGVRRQWLLALQETPPPFELGRTQLQGALRDQDWGVRLEAARLLGADGEGVLSCLVHEAPLPWAAEAVEALAERQSESAWTQICVALERPETLAAALACLQRVPNPLALQGLLAWCQSSTPPDRLQECLLLLQKLADRRAAVRLNPLLGQLQTPHLLPILLETLAVCGDASSRRALYGWLKQAPETLKPRGEQLLAELILQFGPLEQGGLSLTEPRPEEGGLSLAMPSDKTPSDKTPSDKTPEG
ncbi:MAG: hypothetical protein ACKO6N_15100 [Myxococcota bacterium]